MKGKKGVRFGVCSDFLRESDFSERRFSVQRSYSQTALIWAGMSSLEIFLPEGPGDMRECVFARLKEDLVEKLPGESEH